MWVALKKYFSEFKVLKQTPREFWTLNLVINFFEMLAYFSFMTVLTLFLTDNVGFNDQWAGNVVGLFTLLITITIFFAGFIIDSIGVKRALIISMALLIPCRLLIGLTGPIENNYLEKNLDVTAARSMIEAEHLDRSAFTMDNTRLAKAQADLIIAAGKNTADEKELSIDELAGNAQKLREGLLAIAKESPAIRQTYGSDLEEKLKDQNEFKKMVVTLVGEVPELGRKYFVDFSKFDDDPVALKAAVIGVVKSYPDLRAKFSIQDLLKIFVVIILFFTAFGEALMVPAIYAALRRYTSKRTSGTAFNFQYLTMNIGAVLSFVMFDWLRGQFGNEAGNEAIFWAGTIFAIICIVASVTLRANIQVQDDGQIADVPEKKGEAREMPWTIAKSVISESAFWRFMLFIVLLIGVRLTFTHQFLVMPKYYTRVLGDAAPVGLLNTINPTIITIGLILFIPIIMRFTVFRLIVVGTVISSLSVFILAIPGNYFTSLGWTIEDGYWFIILAQVVVFAFGELIWSPRLSEYTVTIAPRGREGTYMSMATLPMFIAKPLNGWLSGLLLTEYCPDGVMNDIVSGARSWYNGPEMMWIIFGVIAISSPILIVLLRKVIRSEEQEEEDVPPAEQPEAQEA